MNIVIDLTSLSYHVTGIERYAACVAEKMIEQDKTNKYRLIFRNNIYPMFEKYIDGDRVSADILYGNKKVIFFQWVLPKHLNSIKADRYLFFAFTSPILFNKKGIFNTIHDMGAWDSPEALTLLQKIYWRTTYRISSRVSERIITVSEFSKKRISEILHYPKDKIEVISSAIYEGIDKDYGYRFSDIKEKYSLPDKYIMTLSTLEPRKNMEILLRAFSNIQNEVDYDLVLVGRKGWKMDDVLNKYSAKERIHVTGFVEDPHVSVIYKHAMCFVFPSLYEGFGLPPVEALSLGTPVIASNAASIPEVLMEQAVYFNNNSEEELERLLLNLNNDLDKMPRELNDIQREKYSFKSSAKKVLDLIKDIEI